MSVGHERVIHRLGGQLWPQLEESPFELRLSAGRVRVDSRTYYLPDLAIVPIVGPDTMQGLCYELEVFRDPLPLVIEAWSPSTGGYDIDRKLPAYQARGDIEIWRLHPFDLVVHGWRRQADGTYTEFSQRTGTVRLIALADVVVDLDKLFR